MHWLTFYFIVNSLNFNRPKTKHYSDREVTIVSLCVMRSWFLVVTASIIWVCPGTFVSLHPSVGLWFVMWSLPCNCCQHTSAPLPVRQTVHCLLHKYIPVDKQSDSNPVAHAKPPEIPQQQAQTFVTHKSCPLYLSSSLINKISSWSFLFILRRAGSPSKQNTRIIPVQLAACIRCPAMVLACFGFLHKQLFDM